MKKKKIKFSSLLLSGIMALSTMGVPVHAMNATGATTIDDKMVFVYDDDVEVTTSSSNGEMKSVIAVYDENKCHINLNKFKQDINDTLVNGAPEGYPYQYVGYADYTSMYFCAVYVEYEKEVLYRYDLDEETARSIATDFRARDIIPVPEGHDKPLKYPLMFQVCDAVIINKIDVAPYFDFDLEKCREYIHLRNPKAEIMPISAKTGEGVAAVSDWLRKEVQAWKA